MIKDKPSTNLLENTELALELYEALEKLSTNPHYQKLIEYGFMEIFTMNQVGMLAHPGTDEKGRESLQRNLESVSTLQNFLIVVERLGENAKAQMHEAEVAEFDSAEG